MPVANEVALSRTVAYGPAGKWDSNYEEKMQYSYAFQVTRLSFKINLFLRRPASRVLVVYYTGKNPFFWLLFGCILNINKI